MPETGTTDCFRWQSVRLDADVLLYGRFSKVLLCLLGPWVRWLLPGEAAPGVEASLDSKTYPDADAHVSFDQTTVLVSALVAVWRISKERLKWVYARASREPVWHGNSRTRTYTDLLCYPCFPHVSLLCSVAYLKGEVKVGAQGSIARDSLPVPQRGHS